MENILSKEFVNKYKGKHPNWGFNGLGYIVYARTYSRIMDNGENETWPDTIARCINGAQLIGAGYTKEEAEQLFDYIFNLKCCFAGRMLWQLGTNGVAKYNANSLLNCLAGETKVLTRVGWKKIEDIANTTQTIVTKNGKWVEAKFKNYGTQELIKVTFQDEKGNRQEIFATPNHRWLIINKCGGGGTIETTTAKLKKGQSVPLVNGKNASNYLSPQGVQHGLVYGDGSCNGYESHIDLIDNTYTECKKYFSLNRITWTNPCNPRHVRYSGMPNYYKELPSINENKPYLMGFLSGWIAADGSVNKSTGSIRLFNKSKRILQQAKDIASVLGFRTHKIRKERDINPFNGKKAELWSLSFYREDQIEKLIIRKDHKKKIVPLKKKYLNRAKVISVEKTTRVEQVFCAEVPETKSFVIEGNILTGNCWSITMNEPEAFCFLFENLMLGGGVGFSVRREDIHELPKIKEGVVITHEQSTDADFIVPDSREGWVMILRKVLKAFYVKGKSFTYSTILVRGKGEAIKGFGGTASGPGILIEGISKISKIFNSREGKKLRSVDVLDICNIIASIVVSGNVRRSATIALGDPDDYLFIRAKRWDLGNIPNHRAMSNNTIYADDYNHISDNIWDGFIGNGEPYGFFNLPLAQKHGRIGDKIKDKGVNGLNPCGEITLENHECCVGYNTPLITKEGITTIGLASDKKQTIEVWNGNEWSEVSPHLTRTKQKLYRVFFGDGSFLDCTSYHKFSVADRFNKNYSAVETSELLSHSKYKLHTEPFKINHFSGIKYKHDAYTLGFVVGDGHVDKGHSAVRLFGDKKMCPVKGKRGDVKQYNKYNVKHQYVNTTLDAPPNLVLKLKNDLSGFDELFSWDRHSILKFIAGMADADGSNAVNGFRIYLSHYERAQKLQLLLTKCGITSSVNLCQKAGSVTNFSIRKKDLYYVQIIDTFEIPTHRLQRTISTNKCKGKWQIIKKIEALSGKHNVYCFNEPKKHMGVFNNTLTYQCNLSDIFLNNIESQEELINCAKLLYKTQKAINTMEFIHPETTKIVHKNMRIGIGVSGICQSLDKLEWLDQCYKEIRELDEKWSKEKNINKSIKITTVKPSGSLSLLSGSTPGVHPSFSKYYIRRIRIVSHDKLIDTCRELGYNAYYVERFDGTIDHSTMIVEFPCYAGDNVVQANDMSAVQQMELIKKMQTVWADNAVSCTVYFKKEEIPEIKEWMKNNYKHSIKSISFLLHKDHGFKQAPYEEITEEQYNNLVKNIKPLKHTAIGEGDVDIEECAGGACPIK